MTCRLSSRQWTGHDLGAAKGAVKLEIHLIRDDPVRGIFNDFFEKSFADAMLWRILISRIKQNIGINATKTHRRKSPPLSIQQIPKFYHLGKSASADAGLAFQASSQEIFPPPCG
jgi:hypothetical protein